MDKVKYLPFIILCMLLSGCGAEKNTISTETPAETAIQTSEIELNTETENSPAANTDAENNAPETKYITIDLSTVRETHPTSDAAAPFD